jgi:hypothetical protein
MLRVADDFVWIVNLRCIPSQVCQADMMPVRTLYYTSLGPLRIFCDCHQLQMPGIATNVSLASFHLLPENQAEY